MAKKNERRRRTLKDPRARGESPFASPPAPQTLAGKTWPQPLHAGGRRASRGVVIAICCLLVLGAAMVFVQTARHGFVDCDDNEYVYQNFNIQHGLTAASAWWAVTQAHSANWHPLTWISHTIDWQAFGAWDADLRRYVASWPGGHHLVSLLLHATNAVLLFLILQRLTGATWPSAVVAALFVIHPLRVESVAWVTGRKDLLSGLFFLLTLAAYQAYAAGPFSFWRYGLVFVSFALGLAAKSMLVTMPFVLLLVDYWPLGRLGDAGRADAGTRRGGTRRRICCLRVSLSPCLRVLLQPRLRVIPPPVAGESSPPGPLGRVVPADGLGAKFVVAFKPLDFQYRVINALLSYAAYIQQMFFPAGMVVQYVHRGPHLQWQDAEIPLAVLVLITLAVVWLGRRRRYLAVGWFWYLGMLVPVIGLVQVGAQARADRYTYLAQIGLYIMIAWGLRDLAGAWRARAALYAAAAVPVIALLTAVAWHQTSYWRNSLTLWEHSVACQPENDFAQNEYGQALNDSGRADDAMMHFRKAFEINELYVTPRINYAAGLWKRNKPAEALEICAEAIAIDPINAQAHAMKAVALFALKQPDESIREFRTAIELDPQNVDAQSNMARVLLAAKHDLDGAQEQFQAALKLRPEDPKLHGGLADVLWRQGKFREAAEHRKHCLALEPQNTALAIQVARKLISDPRPEARFGADALEIARRACEASEYKDMFALDALAAASPRRVILPKPRRWSAKPWRLPWAERRATRSSCRSG